MSRSTEMDFTAPGCQFWHTRDLLSLLFTVAPEVADDPNLVQRSMLLTGVTPHTTPTDLLDLFPLRTDAAVVIRDYETGERAALVVFADEGDCDRAIDRKAPRFRGRVIYYRACIKARAWQTTDVLVEAACDHARRRSMAKFLRTLLPPAYIEDDSSIHMRCIFLRGDYALSSLDEALPVKGKASLCAIIACKARSIVALVYEDAESAEEVARLLIKDRQIGMYDSLMFPFGRATTVRDTAGAAAGGQLRGMIPSSFAQPDYLRRIVLFRFRGRVTEYFDAFYVARCINIDGLEALVIHRSKRMVVAIFSTSEDARLQLRPSQKAATWVSIFGQSPTSKLVDPAEFSAAIAHNEKELRVLAEEDDELVAPAERPYREVHTVARDLVFDLIDKETRKAHDAAGIARVLIMSSVFSRPDVLRHPAYPHKAVLLLGVRDFDYLWAALSSSYGGLDDLYLITTIRAALAVFKTRSAALKLLQEPLGKCLHLGFGKCQRVPRAVRAAEIVEVVSAKLLELDAELKSAQV